MRTSGYLWPLGGNYALKAAVEVEGYVPCRSHKAEHTYIHIIHIYIYIYSSMLSKIVSASGVSRLAPEVLFGVYSEPQKIGKRISRMISD